jgi:peptidyl-prolyl cis-trans isomerase D
LDQETSVIQGKAMFSILAQVINAPLYEPIPAPVRGAQGRCDSPMLALFRSFAKSWVAALLMGLLIVSFAIFGINDVFKPRAQNWVVRAGDRDISATMFKTMFDGAKSQQEQQIGRPITVEEVQQAHFDVLFLKELAGQETLNALLSKWGLRPSDHLVVAELRKQPNFFDQISGAFDQATYERVLAEKLSLKPAQYEGYLRDTMAGEHFSTGIYNGFTVPRIVTAINAAYGMESREATFVAMDPRRVPPPAQPTEAEIKTFYDQNAERLKLPEFRTISIVRFSAQDYLGTVTVDPAKVQKAFDFKKDSLSTPETRSLVQIPIKDQAAEG